MLNQNAQIQAGLPTGDIHPLTAHVTVTLDDLVLATGRNRRGLLF